MVYVSAGRRGIEIGLKPNLLIELTEATLGAFTNPA
jgi:prolyl-tRNA editing enzyme YbaK/EbsC (Cys-tRNA(Pro) deacylase)